MDRMETHESVLLQESIEALELTPHSVVVDATLGAGGHTKAILKVLEKKGILLGIDADPDAVEEARMNIHASASVIFETGNFRDIDSILDTHNLQYVDAIIADLGWRIEQMSGNKKGFSYRFDEPLLMTLGDSQTYPFTATTIVNEWSELDIINVLKGYGEERYAKRIARAIVTRRSTTPIETSGTLADLIEQAVPSSYRHGKLHPATKSFQALRICVNDELDALSDFIKKSVSRLKPGGVLAIISFHSIEDRIVKHLFRSLAPYGKQTTKKPIVPSANERQKNPRARSAKLRIFKTFINHEQKTSSFRPLQE